MGCWLAGRCLCPACVATSTPTSISTLVTVALSRCVGWPRRWSPTRRSDAGHRSPTSGRSASSSTRCLPAAGGRWTTVATSRYWPDSTRPPTGSPDRRHARPTSGRSSRHACRTSCTGDQLSATSSTSSTSQQRRRCSRPPSSSTCPHPLLSALTSCDLKQWLHLK